MQSFTTRSVSQEIQLDPFPSWIMNPGFTSEKPQERNSDMQELEAQNRELTRQLEDLRRFMAQYVFSTKIELAKKKKIVDDLVLKEANSEMNALREKAGKMQEKLDRGRHKSEHVDCVWTMAEEKYQIYLEEERKRTATEESTADCSERISRLVAENKITKLEGEYILLQESHRVVKEENSRLVERVEQVVNEAAAVKEALEIARRENSELKETVTARDNFVEEMRQELECLKLKEADENDGIKDLKDVLDGDQEDWCMIVRK